MISNAYLISQGDENALKRAREESLPDFLRNSRIKTAEYYEQNLHGMTGMTSASSSSSVYSSVTLEGNNRSDEQEALMDKEIEMTSNVASGGVIIELENESNDMNGKDNTNVGETTNADDDVNWEE